MAEEIERYRTKVNFQHKFENVSKQFGSNLLVSSPKFFARNIPFRVDLLRNDNGDISCELACDGIGSEHYYLKVKYRLFLITPSKTVQSAEFSRSIKRGIYSLILNVNDRFWKSLERTLQCLPSTYYNGTVLSKIFPGEEIFVDDAVTLEMLLWVSEPEGIIEYNPPKKKLRQVLQIVENQVQDDAFASLLESEDFSDVTFVTSVDSSKVKAHKAILAARSQVFARMLTTDMKETKDTEIRIDDMGGDAIKIMLHHIYSGQLEFPKGLAVDLKICQQLANAGEKYDLKNLKEYAAMTMTEFVSLENAWDLLMFAKRLKADAATKALTSYYGVNVYKIIEKA